MKVTTAGSCCGSSGLIAFYAGFAAAPISVVAPVAALVSTVLPVGVAIADGERWMFAQRLAGHSTARITRALNDAGIPCPSAADPERNPHRTGAGWTLRTVAAILANSRYTGRQVWNRQRTDFDLVDPGNTGLGHKQVQRWNLPEGWVISRHPAHPALVSEADFIAAQDAAAPRGCAADSMRAARTHQQRHRPARTPGAVWLGRSRGWHSTGVDFHVNPPGMAEQR